MRMLAMIYRVLLASSRIVYASELKMLTLDVVPDKLDVPWFLVVQISMSFELDPFSLKVINFLQVRTLAILQLAILENQNSENLNR